MKERLDDLSMLRDRIADEIGLSNPEDLLAMVENMEQQLVDLYEDRATETDRIPEAIVKTLGVSSPEEADELARAVRRMDERLRTLSSQQERLAAEAGVENADDALSMIRSLEEQLVDLYQERDPNSQGDGSHAPNGVSSSQTDAVSPETDADAPEADAPEADAPEEVFRILGVSTPREARDMAQVVRRMSQRLNALSEEYSKVTSDLGLEDADDTRAMIESMEEQLVDLYQTVEARGTAGDAGQPAGGDATPSGDGAPADHDIDPRVGEILGIQTAEEARELEQLVHDITSQLEHLTAEQEKLQAQGLESVDGALAMIESMEEQLVNVYEQQGTPAEDAAEEAEEDTSEPDTATDVAALMPSRPGDAPAASDETGSDETSSDETSSDAEASAGEAPDPAVYDKMRTLLGVESMEDVEELGEMVHSMSEQLDRLASEHQKLLDVGLSVDHALSMIESMEEQLVDLYQEREGDGAAASAEIPEDAVSYADLQPSLHALCDTLGVDRPADAMSPQESLAAIHDRTQHLLDEGNRVFDDTASIEPASTLSGLLQRVEEQMVDLHHEVNTLQEAKQRFDGVREVLGIETRDQAQELAQLAREMDVQLQQLQENEEALEEIGLSSAQDAVQMIRSMEQQLDELYRDKENLQQQSDAMTINPDQDTFQQLQALYAEQEKLERELGVSSADAIIEMVEGLATQLDDFYASSEGIPYDESGDGSLTAPPDTPADAPSADAPGADASVPDKDFMILSMREQLEALYQEKEALFENGMGDVNEAVSRIGMLQDRVNQLSRENTAYEKRLQRLKNEIGTADVQKVIKIVRSLKSRVLQREERKGSASPSGSASAGNASSSDAASPERGTGLFISAAPQFADDETLDRLEEMSSSELNDLPYGVIRLANDGSVEFVNEQGLSLPGLEEVNQRSTLSGKNFFLDLAPSTKNNLFFGRFKEGLRQGAMDARFPYTFISPGRAPKVLTVHLHRKPDEDANWLLFRSM
jgi:photoactive yellow protein